MQNKQFDVVIIGGGMVGICQAVALSKQNKSVLLVERSEPQSSWLEKAPLRVSAINLFSEKYLNELGVWPHIQDTDKQVFEQLATWEGRTKPLVFSNQDIGESHLGYLIRNEALQLAGYQAAEQNELGISFLYGSTLTTISNLESGVQLTFEQDEKSSPLVVTASLVIGADGANSQVRQLANIGITGWDYQQHCLSITIKTDFPAQTITWQEFQPSGPKAFLPLADGYASLIWYDSADKIATLKHLSNAELKKEILATFPPLAGDFEVAQFASFPLTRRQANDYYNNRVVLVGDAAHTINPLAGQGVNLGYQDVHKLTELLTDIDLTDAGQLKSALKQYQRIRKVQTNIMSSAMDSFYLLFSNNKSVFKHLRGALLTVASQFTWAKKQVLKKAVGY